MKDPSKKEHEVITELPVRRRSTEYGDGESIEALTVGCPVKGGSVDFEHCQNCERLMSAQWGDGAPTLICSVPAESVRSPEMGRTLDERLRTARVAEIMSRQVTCADSELDLFEVAHLLEDKNLHAVPVVEDAGVLLGIVSKGDLIRGHARADEGASGDETLLPQRVGVLAEDVMTTDVARINESASLASAVECFAKTKVHRLPVVSKDDVVAGVLSMLDLIQWIADQKTVCPS
jgi:CBS domain-containing protein